MDYITILYSLKYTLTPVTWNSKMKRPKFSLVLLLWLLFLYLYMSMTLIVVVERREGETLLVRRKKILGQNKNLLVNWWIYMMMMTFGKFVNWCRWCGRIATSIFCCCWFDLIFIRRYVLLFFKFNLKGFHVSLEFAYIFVCIYVCKNCILSFPGHLPVPFLEFLFIFGTIGHDFFFLLFISNQFTFNWMKKEKNLLFFLFVTFSLITSTDKQILFCFSFSLFCLVFFSLVLHFTTLKTLKSYTQIPFKVFFIFVLLCWSFFLKLKCSLTC